VNIKIMIAIMIIWIGVVYLLLKIERKIKSIEKEIDEQ